MSIRLSKVSTKISQDKFFLERLNNAEPSKCKMSPPQGRSPVKDHGDRRPDLFLGRCDHDKALTIG